jgi:hypothetical protein
MYGWEMIYISVRSTGPRVLVTNKKGQSQNDPASLFDKLDMDLLFKLICKLQHKV